MTELRLNWPVAIVLIVGIISATGTWLTLVLFNKIPVESGYELFKILMSFSVGTFVPLTKWKIKRNPDDSLSFKIGSDPPNK